MKKNLFYLLGLMAICLFTFSSCSSESPGDAAKKYMNYMKSGDYDKFVDGIAVGEDTPKDEVEAGKTMLKAMMEKGKKQVDAKGGIKDIEIVSEEIEEDGKAARVVLKTTYGDGSTEEKPTNMVLEKGKWKMKVKM